MSGASDDLWDTPGRTGMACRFTKGHNVIRNHVQYIYMCVTYVGLPTVLRTLPTVYGSKLNTTLNLHKSLPPYTANRCKLKVGN